MPKCVTISDFHLDFELAWEPCIAQDTHDSYFRRLPALGRKLRFSLVFPMKVDLLNVEP